MRCRKVLPLAVASPVLARPCCAHLALRRQVWVVLLHRPLTVHVNTVGMRENDRVAVRAIGVRARCVRERV